MTSTTPWLPAAVAAIADRPIPAAPVVDPRSVRRLLPEIDLWDMWPVQKRDGKIAPVAGGELWMVLSAPASPDPELRHGLARIRLLHRVGGAWNDLGELLPSGINPGSREWAGSAVLGADGVLVLYFTAAGRRGETEPSFAQRLFETRAQIVVEGSRVQFRDWSAPFETVVPDGVLYTREMSGGGAIGTIKAFRDPSYFRDPFDGAEYLLFTASLASSASAFNGAIGVAVRIKGRWRLLPPLVTADGLNNELERPHVVYHKGRYYLFWSTQGKVFAPDGPTGPTGLYGMATDRFGVDWRPLNGTGLVLANPTDAPHQAFSWLVTHELEVMSFLDFPGLSRAARNTDEARARFGGTPAPAVRIAIEGDSTRVVG